MACAIEGELTIYTANAVRERLVTSLQTDTDLVLELAGVSEIDTAGVQLLLAAQREAVLKGRELQLASVSPSVREVLELMGLSANFKDALGAA